MRFDRSRRRYLKGAGATLAGIALLGCGSRSDEEHNETAVSGAGDSAEDAYDSGTVPVERSGWARTGAEVRTYPALEHDLTCDVAIIGSGLAGSSLALHLAEKGISVTVLEARQPGWGASGRNAGHVLPVLKDLSVFQHFPDRGKAMLDLFRQHHTITFEIATKYGIDCDATRSGYLNAIKTKDALAAFRRGSDYWAGQGQAVEILGAGEMKRATGSGYYPYGVLYRDGGRVNPYLFSNGMIVAAEQLGARVFGNSEALSIHKAGSGWRVATRTGSVTASRVVFCTNAYSTEIVPEFNNSFYPLTAYALATKPIPEAARDIVMPSRATLAQVPFDLNPFLVDCHHRIVTASIPSALRPADAGWHFAKHLNWIHRTWPETRKMGIELDSYWTGRVALRDKDFPGVYEIRPGVYGLMHFNAWGNVMAPLMAKIMAEAIATGRTDRLPFPIAKPEPVMFRRKQELIIRDVMIPAARLAQDIGLI